MNHTTKKDPCIDDRSVLEQAHAVIHEYKVTEPRIVTFEGPNVGSRRSFLEVENNDTVDEFDGTQTDWILVQRRVRGAKREDREKKIKDNTEHRVGGGKQVCFARNV